MCRWIGTTEMAATHLNGLRRPPRPPRLSSSPSTYARMSVELYTLAMQCHLPSPRLVVPHAADWQYCPASGRPAPEMCATDPFGVLRQTARLTKSANCRQAWASFQTPPMNPPPCCAPNLTHAASVVVACGPLMFAMPGTDARGATRWLEWSDTACPEKSPGMPGARPAGEGVLSCSAYLQTPRGSAAVSAHNRRWQRKPQQKEWHTRGAHQSSARQLPHQTTRTPGAPG